MASRVLSKIDSNSRSLAFRTRAVSPCARRSQQQETDVQSDRCTESEENQRQQHRGRAAAVGSRHERGSTQDNDGESEQDRTGSDPATAAAVTAKERKHGHGIAALRGSPARGRVNLSGSYALIPSPFREDATPGRYQESIRARYASVAFWPGSIP